MDADRKQALVLVIHRQPEVLGSVAAALDRAGYACQCCRTAESAVAFARSCAPDLIVSEVNLGGVSGLEVCERILEENGTLERVPLMFLSAAQIPDIIRRTHAVGGVYYLRYPFDAEVLVDLVDTALVPIRELDSLQEPARIL